MDETKMQPRQRAVLAVLRAGKQAELDKYVDSQMQATRARFAEILDDSDRSDSWKAERVAEIESSAYDDLDRELDRLSRSGRDAINSDFGRVFGTVGIPGDAASLAISRRDAGDRVASVQSAEGLMSLLARADQSGDETLARAVAERAYDVGEAAVLDRFLESRPTLREPTERLWTRRNTPDHERNYLFNFSMRLSAFKAPRNYAPIRGGVARKVR